jgi:hypothetical protein
MGYNNYTMNTATAGGSPYHVDGLEPLFVTNTYRGNVAQFGRIFTHSCVVIYFSSFVWH